MAQAVRPTRRTRSASCWGVHVEDGAAFGPAGVDVVLDAARNVHERPRADVLAEDRRSTVEHPEMVVVEAMGVRSEMMTGKNDQNAGLRALVAPEDLALHAFDGSDRLDRQAGDDVGAEDVGPRSHVHGLTVLRLDQRGKGRRTWIGRRRPVIAGRASRRLVAVLAAAVGLLVPACQTKSSTSPTAPSVDEPTASVTTEEYLPALEEDLYVPSRTGSATTLPLVVMIPGGAWVTADRTGLAPLASYLSDHGLAVANATIRGAKADFRFPGPVQDVLCAVDAAVERTRQRGLTPAPVVVMGHSSGAHLSALAALGAVDERGDCPHPASRIDAAVLLSGIYDPALAADVAEPLMGTSPQDDPAGWRTASAFTWVANRPELPVLLAHGDRDELVPESFTTRFATALEQGGHAVSVDIVPDAGHHEIYSPDAVGAGMVRWVATLR
jgi:acetyl esterase/lipase